MTPQRKEAGKGRQPIFESRLCPKDCGRTQVTSLPGVSTSAPGKEPQRTEISAQPRTASAAQRPRPRTDRPPRFRTSFPKPRARTVPAGGGSRGRRNGERPDYFSSVLRAAPDWQIPRGPLGAGRCHVTLKVSPGGGLPKG